jgi:hypothetical protein
MMIRIATRVGLSYAIALFALGALITIFAG